MFLLCVMIRRRPRSTRTDTRCTCPTRFQSNTGQRCERANGRRWIAPDYGETRVGMAVPDLRKAAPRETFHSLHIGAVRSEEHTSELQSLMRISYAVFCLNTKTYVVYTHKNIRNHNIYQSRHSKTTQPS